ncbi:MAG: hypothetical protein QW128_04770 [Thermoprotei archaeon]
MSSFESAPTTIVLIGVSFMMLLGEINNEPSGPILNMIGVPDFNPISDAHFFGNETINVDLPVS